MDVHAAHTCYTLRKIYNHVLEGKKLIKRFKHQHKVKVFTVASFEGDDEKEKYASFKHIFI